MSKRQEMGRKIKISACFCVNSGRYVVWLFILRFVTRSKWRESGVRVADLEFFKNASNNTCAEPNY